MTSVTVEEVNETATHVVVSYSQSVTSGDQTVTRSASLTSPISMLGAEVDYGVEQILDILKKKTSPNGTNAIPQLPAS